jgi:hypothetical protein
MKSEPAYDTMFQTLVDIRKHLDEKINFLDEQLRGAQLKCLEEAFEQQKENLAECLDGIDQQLINLSVYIEEYRRLQKSLKNLHDERIPELGGTPPAMPDTLAGDSAAEILAARLDDLKSQGKIQTLKS